MAGRDRASDPASGASADGGRLAPLVLATMASQALLVVLAPAIVAIADDLDTSVAAAGQARSITAAVSVAVSLALASRLDAIGIPRLLAFGAGLAIVSCGAVAASFSLAAFLLVHVLVGVSFACLLSAGFAGVAAFRSERRAWAIGYVAGANALAWIVVNPLAGVLVDWLSWRAAQAVPAAIALVALALAPKASPTSDGAPATGLRTLLAEPSARRWIGSELVAFAGWTALLTYAGAFFVTGLGTREAVVGWLLAAGAGAYFFAASRSGQLAERLPRRPLIAATSVLMAALVAVQLNVTGSVVLALALFCAIGLVAGARTPASSALGLDQLPARPGAMMAARTAATQLGYLFGAVVGGIVIAGPGFGALGFALAAAMVASALLVLRVDDPRG